MNFPQLVICIQIILILVYNTQKTLLEYVTTCERKVFHKVNLNPVETNIHFDLDGIKENPKV